MPLWRDDVLVERLRGRSVRQAAVGLYAGPGRHDVLCAARGQRWRGRVHRQHDRDCGWRVDAADDRAASRLLEPAAGRRRGQAVGVAFCAVALRGSRAIRRGWSRICCPDEGRGAERQVAPTRCSVAGGASAVRGRRRVGAAGRAHGGGRRPPPPRPELFAPVVDKQRPKLEKKKDKKQSKKEKKERRPQEGVSGAGAGGGSAAADAAAPLPAPAAAAGSPASGTPAGGGGRWVHVPG
eukprot:SAG22_NODE_3371_length_1751_cov_1.228814_2_plen_238_part_00